LPPISPEEKFPTCSVDGKEGIDTAIGCIGHWCRWRYCFSVNCPCRFSDHDLGWKSR
jgi:hypothetical protein